MIRFVRLLPELLAELEIEGDRTGSHICANATLRDAVCTPPAVALAMLDDTRVIGAGGAVPVWDGRWYVWLQPGRDMTKRQFFLAATRCAQEMRRLEWDGARRIECVVRADIAAHERFALQLGFVRECVMRAWSALGEDYGLWARVSERGSCEGEVA